MLSPILPEESQPLQVDVVQDPLPHLPTTRTMVVLPIALSLFVGGCREGTGRNLRVAEQDSSGIMIVDNRGAPPEEGSLAVSPHPDLIIGTNAGAPQDQLWDVAGAACLSDGRIVVANRGTLEIRLYDLHGQFLESFGGEGEGPGEFSYMEMAGVLPGDTMVISDLDLRRITLFHSDVGFVRSALISPEVHRWNWTMGLMGRRIMRGGMERYDLSANPGERKGLERIPTSFQTITLDGILDADFGDFPFRDVYRDLGEINGHRTAVAYDVPLGAEASFAVGGDRLFFGTGDEFEILVFDSEARLLKIFRWDRERVRIRPDHLAALRREREVEAENAEEVLEVRQEFEKVPAGTWFPAFLGFDVDAAGYLWVGEYPRPDSNSRLFHIFDTEGRLVAELDLPRKLEILEIGVDYLLAVVHDEMGVEYLHRYNLRRF